MIATFQDISIIELLHTLQEPAPQYVLGCGPAVATIGTSPESGLINKLLWLLRCLGCPFTGLFYACGIRNDPIAMSIYWLTSDHFRRDGNILPYRPFGLYTMKIAEDERNEEVIRLLKECMAEASVLGRLSSLASAYYIFLGIFTGLIKALQIGPCTEEDWPYLPLALAWTLPAICRRVFGGKMIVNDPRVRLRDMHVVVSDLQHHESHEKSAQVSKVLIILLFSILIPWISVLLAYFTRPKIYSCRSIYLTVLSSIWSFNNVIAYISHILGEKSVEGNKFIHGWFCLCGSIIFILLILLGLLSHTRSWWLELFGGCTIKC
ncbi:hypothetical protein RhiirA5_452474 [Rhizophagus irregularis]|uniref:Uncharacterized protein n=2 Tax=Rhizophagus irregularis TaxID=588596 RepID=A0A2N0P864_9GLOM|nr:hypothetical protein GLOIN_2v1827304 [Rhizophagus irregularis DAOM 181602=DAOM 197198]PKC03028.1 hypothetical protein RhiirA5_452474 [Rhizophagus irregularis]POG73687.1 hypothetical protein GLOIN_2v1827304 [Rhizophagus irregularis DAOM 181602=DAOM 197198]CAB5197054.1 unnamed protein product [Rhizophagus irregularis]|eukprot:XP_025180553.1 hypothetical protein GLOIN_2v1827304 [Rhizophagus irregularis DAOM 181602=DAOM 197198]